MTARVLDGNVVAAIVKDEVAAGVEDLRRRGVEPGLATVLVGEDPASAVYVRNKRRSAEQLGIASSHHELPATTSQQEVEAVLADLGRDPAVHGILLQLPLPDGLDSEAAVRRIPPAKDVDGLHPENLGLLALDRPGLRPCTPSGCLRILDHYGIPTGGEEVVIVGRSLLVGRPLSIMLSGKERNATVTLAHSRTRDLVGVCRRAAILVVAVGRPGLVTAEFVQPGATVIDVGINRTEAGLVGDVDASSVGGVAGWLTPVPGGVGPMTIAMLMANTLRAAVGILDKG